MRHVHEPFTLRTHAALQDAINEMMIAIKLHYGKVEKAANEEQYEKDLANWAKAKSNYRQPSWDEVLEILNKSFHALDEQRYNPIKY